MNFEAGHLIASPTSTNTHYTPTHPHTHPQWATTHEIANILSALNSILIKTIFIISTLRTKKALRRRKWNWLRKSQFS